MTLTEEIEIMRKIMKDHVAEEMTQIEKQPELLPCPMCGGEAKHGKFDVTPDAIKAVHELYYHFACTACGLATAECEYTTIEQAAAAWNTRTPTAREVWLEDQIKTLKKKLHNRKLEVKYLVSANSCSKKIAQGMQNYLSNLRDEIKDKHETTVLLRRQVRELKLEIEKTRDAVEKELEALLQPFAQFGQALLAMEEIGDIDKLEDNNCVAAISGGGGTFMLLWKHFKEIILYLYK